MQHDTRTNARLILVWSDGEVRFGLLELYHIMLLFLFFPRRRFLYWDVEPSISSSLSYRARVDAGVARPSTSTVSPYSPSMVVLQLFTQHGLDVFDKLVMWVIGQTCKKKESNPKQETTDVLAITKK